ncbi:MAG: hypothetical protein IT372_14975 [Polyangiaceae bacterium]|nr:hypothetical protein [Polyangiaceae bacterium]
MRRCLTHALFALALTTPLTALAQDPNCPPGAWFCEATEVPQPPADGPDADAPGAVAPAAPAPPPHARPGHSTAKAPPRQAPAPPPVVIYQSPSSPPPQVVIVAPGGQPPPGVVVRTPPAPPPPPPKPRWREEWGINLRVEGIALGKDRGSGEHDGMGGVGLSFRYRPVPAFAFDVGVDVIGGVDYNGYERTEIPLSLNGILYVNPRSRVQFYFMGGIHASHAEVDVPTTLEADESGPDSIEPTQYDYFGGQGGIGLEFRLSRRVALNIDALAFVRKRTDDGTTPEFTDPETGRTTDTSGGGLFRGGISFYW